MLDVFTLDKAYRYIIYGAAEGGKLVYENMNRCGYHIMGFFDRRAKEIGSLYGLEVFDPEIYPHSDTEHTVIIISVRTPFEHESIATYLHKFGYDKIIYRPCSGIIPNSGEMRQLEQTYERLISGDITEDCVFIKYVDQMNIGKLFNDAVIEQGDELIVAYIPTDLCFAASREQIQAQNVWVEIETNQCVIDRIDLPIYMGWYEVIHFFKACMGMEYNATAAVQAYKDWVGKNPLARWNLYERDDDAVTNRIVERIAVYNGLESVYKRGAAFFEAHPVLAEWNPKGYFNIKDGGHRVSFFVAKGVPLIPASMSKSDYDSWINGEALEQCRNFMFGKNMLAAYAPIPHPNFYQFSTYRDIGGYTRIQKISEFLCYNQIKFTDRKILDAGAYYCYLSQFFARLGACVTAIEYNRESHEFAKRLNKLLYCSEIKCVCASLDDFDISQHFSLTIMLTVLYPYMDSEMGLRILKNIDTVTDDILIWESGDQPEKEIRYIKENSNFSHYLKISDTIGTGKVRELGIFYKNHIQLEKPYWL
ncbi:hypothetical protein [Candidatus Agathobaculum pullicola]|uniref:hypothetical protein n=1 Tax=Candidatus Agathobaculum pullicola TaxID=2838426 RepID=UPI003F914835